MLDGGRLHLLILGFMSNCVIALLKCCLLAIGFQVAMHRIISCLTVRVIPISKPRIENMKAFFNEYNKFV